MKKYVFGLLFLLLTSYNKSLKDNLQQHKNPEINHSKMITLGLIGGTSWHSTIDYYRMINQSINDYFGDNTNPPLLVYTLNQSEVHRFQIENKWDSIANMLIDAALNLNKAGAKAVLFCANTPHKVYNTVQQKLDFPVIHIADATAKTIHTKGLKKVGFIGTKYSMEEDFITKRIEDNGIEVIVPKEQVVIEELQRIIEDELIYGIVNKQSKKYVLSIIQEMIVLGAEGIILGCTEFPLLIFQEDLDIHVFDTTEIHSKAGVEFILQN